MRNMHCVSNQPSLCCSLLQREVKDHCSAPVLAVRVEGFAAPTQTLPGIEVLPIIEADSFSSPSPTPADP